MEESPKKLNTKAYVITLKEEEALNQWLDEQLKAGLIVESKSRYVVSCFYIPKKDSSLWLVQDYRKLNQVTIKDKTPLPLIRKLIDKLKEAKYFNKLDLIWGYNNVWIKEGVTNFIQLVSVIRRVCGQTWTRVRIKYYNY